MPEPIKVTKGGVIVPEWGNGDRDDNEKITIHYHFLTFAEQQALLEPKDLGKSFAYESRVLAAMIDKIDNLQVQEDGEKKVKNITNGQQLVDEPGLDALAMELWLAFRGMTAVDKKKS